MLLVFTNRNAIVGPSLNSNLTPEEKDRLRMAVTNLRAEVAYDLGTTITMACDSNCSMVAGDFLDAIIGYSLKAFSDVDELVEKINRLHLTQTVATIIVSCLSFYPARIPEETFYPVFWKWWNERCYFFGMPAIPTHDRDGDQSALLIDYQKREVKWLLDVGKLPQPLSAHRS